MCPKLKLFETDLELLFGPVEGELPGEYDLGRAALGDGATCFSLSARSFCNLQTEINIETFWRIPLAAKLQVIRWVTQKKPKLLSSKKWRDYNFKQNYNFYIWQLRKMFLRPENSLLCRYCTTNIYCGGHV